MAEQSHMAGGEVAQERPAAKLARPLRDFLETEAAAGIVLLGAVVVALIWANSPLSDLYEALWSTEVEFRAGPVSLEEDLRHWVNDGLMVIFFFVVGLEIKRELAVGDLSTWRQAALPATAAVGGMAVPAVLYFALNSKGEASQGWGIPMATDIALALGVLTVLGRFVPSQLRVLLLSLAIVDDIGAVLVIAIFYSENISGTALAVAAVLLLVILGLRALRVWWVPIYALVGVGVWLATLQSGIHATIAGVVLGLLAPARPLDAEAVKGPPLAKRGEGVEGGVTTPEARVTTSRVKASVPVTERLTHVLHPWASFLVLPLFALANAGVSLGVADISGAAASSVAWGIAVGLVIGKLVGISAFSLLSVKLGATMPREVGWGHIIGVSMLAGIGFTMSLFITELAFEQATLLEEAKIGILFGSLTAALVGSLVLAVVSRQGSGGTTSS